MIADWDIFDQRRSSGLSVVHSPVFSDKRTDQQKKYLGLNYFLQIKRTVARRNVVYNRALVAVGPCKPLEFNRVSSVDFGI